MKILLDGFKFRVHLTCMTAAIQPLSQRENNNLKSSGDTFEFFAKMGNSVYSGRFEARLFWMIKTDGNTPTDRILSELKIDGLISEISDKFTIHFTEKGVAKFRRSKI